MAFPTTLSGDSSTCWKASATLTNGVSTAVNVPNGSNVVGYLVVIIGFKDGTGTFTWPAGWTVIGTCAGASSAHYGEARYRIIDGTEVDGSSTPWDGTGDSITITHASEETVFKAVTFSAWHGTSPPEGAKFGPATQADADPANLVPSWGAADDFWIAACGTDASTAITGYPTTYTDNRLTGDTGGTEGVGWAYCTHLLNAASDDPSVFTHASEQTMAFTIAVRPTGVAATQTAVASADSVDGNWTDQADATNLALAIDETTADDSDYIKSEMSPVNSECRVKLGSLIDPASSTGHTIRWRVSKSAGAGTLDMRVRLMQGGGNVQGGGGTIATFARSDVPEAWTTYAEGLSGAQADAITNYADLYLEFWANET